jgi:hypothetical protein
MDSSQSRTPPAVVSAAPAGQSPVSEAALGFLYKEYDILKDLYVQAEQTAQSIFNFYLTLITTITGAIVILMQISEKNLLNSTQTQVTVSGMLLFTAMVGSVYLSSITGRYAHMARYARGMDQIRRFLIRELHVPLPPVYRNFLKPVQRKHLALPGLLHQAWNWLTWLFPTGTYQLFIAVFNSLSLSLGVGMFLFAGGALDQHSTRGVSAAAMIIIFGLTFVISNVYSQLTKRVLLNRLNVQFDSQGEMEWMAGKV